jgi:DNA-binding protein HU-beta
MQENLYMEAFRLTKAELVENVAGKLEVTKKGVAPIVEEVFESITAALVKGEKCTFVGFGVFEVKDRAAREGRNPQDPTKIVKIPAKKVPVFRSGKGLKEAVSNPKHKKK